MRFYTADNNGRPELFAGFKENGPIYRIADFGMNFRDMNDLICSFTEKDRSILESGHESRQAFRLKTMKLYAPIISPLQDMICLGINYSEHAAEAEEFSSEAFKKQRPETIYFGKRVNEAVGDGDEIPDYDGLVDSLDYEVELGVILGRDAKNVRAEDAAEYIFGYTIINDISARNLQTRHKQWYLGKSLDRFTPMGPCIVTADEIGNAQDLDIKSYVNGELRQNSNTGLMIQTIGGAIEELSAGMTLKAGTIIATGTPSGVGMGFKPPRFLKAGDKVACCIEKIGTIENTIVRE